MIKMSDRQFGCEFEFSSDFDDVEAIVKPRINSIYGDRSVMCTDIYMSTENNKNYWHLKRDFSTSTELCTPISTKKELTSIARVLEHCWKNGIQITKDDSLHVHVHAPDIPKENILVAWMYIEPAILKCFPKHRRKNEYCEKFIHNAKKNKNIANFLRTAEKFMDDHHHAMSLSHYKKRKTFEIRISEGTCCKDHIKNWVRFCLNFACYARGLDVLYAVCGKPNILTVEDMIVEMKIRDKKVARWLLDRYAEFSS